MKQMARKALDAFKALIVGIGMLSYMGAMLFGALVMTIILGTLIGNIDGEVFLKLMTR